MKSTYYVKIYPSIKASNSKHVTVYNDPNKPALYAFDTYGYVKENEARYLYAYKAPPMKDLIYRGKYTKLVGLIYNFKL